MARQRDHKAAYQRRKELAAARGVSLSQARGHPRAGETPVSELKRRGDLPGAPEPTLAKVYRVRDRIERGESLTRASKAEGVSPKTVRRHNKDLGLFGKTYKPDYEPGKQPAFAGWDTGGDRPHFPIITEDGSYLAQVPFDNMHASIMARYWNAVGKAFNGDDSALKSFEGITIYDLNGNTYQLSTNIDMIRFVQLGLSDEEQDDFERNFYVRKGVQRAA